MRTINEDELITRHEADAIRSCINQIHEMYEDFVHFKKWSHSGHITRLEEKIDKMKRDVKFIEDLRDYLED
jgi:hypothetical protein